MGGEFWSIKEAVHLFPHDSPHNHMLDTTLSKLYMETNEVYRQSEGERGHKRGDESCIIHG